MAKALQCPDCGTRHPLDEVAHLRTFRCRECRRLLKVPAGVSAAVPSSGERAKDAPPVTPTDAGEPTRVAKANGSKRLPPSQRGDAIARQTGKMEAVAASAPARSPVPRLVRVFIWAVAIPVGILPVVVVGRLLGVLSVNRAVDMFVGVGWGRFVPPLLVLPVWAAISATIAHFSIEGIARSRSR